MLSASIWLIFLQKGFEPAKRKNLPAESKESHDSCDRGFPFENKKYFFEDYQKFRKKHEIVEKTLKN